MNSNIKTEDDPAISSSDLLGFVDPTYGTICDLLNEVRSAAIEGQCMRIGQRSAMHRIAAELRRRGKTHAVLDLLDVERMIHRAASPGDVDRLGSSVMFGIFSIGVREGWIVDLSNETEAARHG